MGFFDKLPKSLKKTIRYILQEVDSLDKLEEIQRILNSYINQRMKELKKKNKVVG